MQITLFWILHSVIPVLFDGKMSMAFGFFGGLGLFSTVVLDGTKVERNRAAVAAKRTRTRVLIVGAGTVGRTLAESLEQSGTHDVVGFADDQLDPVEATDVEMNGFLGTRRDIPQLVKQYAIDEVIIAYAPTWQQRLTEQLAAESPEVNIRVVPSPYESMMNAGQLHHLGDIALVKLDTSPNRLTDLMIRIFDVFVASCGLLLMAPFVPLIALAIKLSSKGPVIFSQERVGQYEKVFLVHKFRTMEQNAERATGPVLAAGMSDARLTSVGRWLRLFRIDELPQLWNVLCGQMSLVGPRPERPSFVAKFRNMTPTYTRRHDVRPGITGLAQVCGGYHTDARDKLRFDLAYVSHRSVSYDIKILLRTILVIVFPTSR